LAGICNTLFCISWRETHLRFLYQPDCTLTNEQLTGNNENRGVSKSSVDCSEKPKMGYF